MDGYNAVYEYEIEIASRVGIVLMGSFVSWQLFKCNEEKFSFRRVESQYRLAVIKEEICCIVH